VRVCVCVCIRRETATFLIAVRSPRDNPLFSAARSGRLRSWIRAANREPALSVVIKESYKSPPRSFESNFVRDLGSRRSTSRPRLNPLSRRAELAGAERRGEINLNLKS